MEKMMNAWRKLLVIGGFISGISVLQLAQAGVLYDEAVSGDIPVFSNYVFTLSSGINDVRGSGAYYHDAPFDFDGFKFVVGAGQQLQNVQYIVTKRVLPVNVSSLDATYRLDVVDYYLTSPLGYGTADIFHYSEAITFFSSASFPLHEGMYTFTPMSGSVGWNGGFGSDPMEVTWDYIVRFNVADVNTVPEPATTGLLGLGLLAFAARRRKQA